MKQVFSGLLGLGFLGFALFAGFMHTAKSPEKAVLALSPIPLATVSPTFAITRPLTKTLFVPYWAIDAKKIDTRYDQYVYFGIEGTTDGITTTDAGYKNIDGFLMQTNDTKKRLLAVRMVNSNTNATVLSNVSLQRNIAAESASIAKEKGFDGVVLDFEIAAISFDSVIKSVNDFVKEFSKETNKQQLSFYITVYGDTYYRLRPYDITILDKDVDGFFIMAYDLHKASGNDPGPNLPLSGKETYGYDFSTMTSDLLNHTKPGKLSIIFGMYGYDWQLDDKKQTIGAANTITLTQAQQKFSSCNLKNCFLHRDVTSTEMNATYTDSNNTSHVVWYEDMTSVEKKTEFLQSKGINSIGYWAYSYF